MPSSPLCPVREPPTSTTIPSLPISDQPGWLCGSLWQGISLLGISSQQDPISPRPLSPASSDHLLAAECCVDLPPLQFPWRCLTWGGRVPGKDWSSLFFQRRGGVGSFAWEHSMLLRSVNRALTGGSCSPPTVGVQVSQDKKKYRKKDGSHLFPHAQTVH